MIIRQATKHDLEHISNIHSTCFPREKNHGMLIKSCFNSFPKSIYYIYVGCNGIQSYILWSIRYNFREDATIELEQLGVDPEDTAIGVTQKLITETLQFFKCHVAGLGLDADSLMVTTSQQYHAEELYQSISRCS